MNSCTLFYTIFRQEWTKVIIPSGIGQGDGSKYASSKYCDSSVATWAKIGTTSYY